MLFAPVREWRRLQVHLEKHPPTFARAAVRLAPVDAGNLLNEGQPQPEALAGLGAPGGAVERLEDPLPLFLGNARRRRVVARSPAGCGRGVGGDGDPLA
jgi:hypothetical protein